MTTSADDDKQAVRERIWALLDDRHAVLPPGAARHIPSFVSADQAAYRLAALSEWQVARVIKANPDKAQLPARVQALRDGKLLYMAVPRLATEKPFFLLDPSQLDAPFEQAASSRGAQAVAQKIGVDEMLPVDLIVCGSVAVNRDGARIGKGAGYSDIEVALLAEAGLISEWTTIVTTVHQLQLVDEALPETEHDFRVDLIVTPDDVVTCPRVQRPSGLVWAHLDEAKVKAIPALAARPGDHITRQR